MPEHVADTLERLTAAQQVNGQRVTQGMGTAAGGLDARLRQAAGQPTVDLAAKRATRWPAREEYLSTERWRPFLAKVVEDRFPHGARQRQSPAPSRFWCEDCDLVVRPVDVVES